MKGSDNNNKLLVLDEKFSTIRNSFYYSCGILVASQGFEVCGRDIVVGSTVLCKFLRFYDFHIHLQYAGTKNHLGDIFFIYGAGEGERRRDEYGFRLFDYTFRKPNKFEELG